MKIRKTYKKDLKEISQLYNKIMSPIFLKVGEKPISSDKYFKILNKNLRNSFMFVLEGNGIKGFIWFTMKSKEYNLEEIFVLDKNMGYGKVLMNYLLKSAKKNKINKINLDVHQKNYQAINFFNKFRFTKRTIEMSRELR